MRAVIVYESMVANTYTIADAVGEGLEPMLEVVVVPLAEAGRERLGDADLLVVGGPTHFHGMSRSRSRKWAAGIAQKPGNDLVLDRNAEGAGVRDWLTSLGHGHAKVAAFDTRFNGLAGFTGRASKRSAERFGSTGSRWSASPRASWSIRSITSNRARRPEAKNGANASRQASCRAAPAMRTVRDKHPRPRGRDVRGDDPNSG